MKFRSKNKLKTFEMRRIGKQGEVNHMVTNFHSAGCAKMVLDVAGALNES